MSSGSVKNPFSGDQADDALNLDELIRAIANSALSEGKKMAYLYLIADGSFSLDHMEGLSKDMDEAGEKLERKVAYREKKIKDYDARIATVDREIVKLTPPATEEIEQNLDKYVAAVSRETEAGSQKTKEEHIAHLKTKIQKKHV